MNERKCSNPWFGGTRLLIRTAIILLAVLLFGTDSEAQTWQRMKMEFPEGYGRISTISSRFAFASKDIGWLYTRVEDSAALETKAYCLFKTTNGGDNWFIQRDFGLRSVGRTIFATDTNHLWVGLFRSTDGGHTWDDSVSTHPKRLDFTEIFFFDSLSGVAVGTIPGTTTDGGRTWTSHDSLHEALWPMKLSFPTMTHGWAACYGYPHATDVGSILNTTDGGVTWSFQNPPAQMQFFPPMGSVAFIDTLNGFAYRSWMYTTTDGGESWVFHPDSPLGGDIVFLSEKFCCLSGTYGIFWYSFDRGNTWTSDTTEYKALFQLYPIPKEGYIFAWGTRSDDYSVRELLRGDFRSLTMVEESGVAIKRTANTPTLDAWPQPVTVGGRLSIRIAGETEESYILTLFDLLGRKRAELQANAGKTASIDAGALQLAPGVYLLRAVSANGAQATRMISVTGAR